MHCTPLNGCYQIYSIGDSGFLRQILDAVAGITSSGGFSGACAAGLLLGVIITLFRSLFSGALKIDFGVIYISFLLYGLLFVPKTTVMIEDAYTGVIYTVDSVPVGIAAPGHIISKVGFSISESVDQAFSSPSFGYGVTRRPFLEALAVIARLRDEDFLNSIWTALQETGSGDDIKSSVKSFWRDCVMLRYQFMNGRSAASDADRSVTALISEFHSKIYGTVSYTPAGAKEITCSEASVKVGQWLEKLTPELVDRAGYFSSSRDPSRTATDLINGSLEMLGASSVSATQMVKASLLLPLYQRGASDYYHSSQNFSAAAMTGQAVMQRNIQWAAEQSVFMTTVRPFVTFFEGFIYAIAPFMAILICVGGFGISVAVRYFQTLVWIQLWMPILCIINLYICSGFRSETARYLAGARAWDSPAVLEGIHSSIQSWMATAGMLAAATPLIALFIVTASTYTFTTLAGRMGGGDHVDEKIMAPDLVSQPPLMTNEHSSLVMTGTGGVLKSRAPHLPSITFSAGDSKALSSTYQSGISRTLAESKAINESWLQSVGVSRGFDQTESVQNVVNSSGSTVLASVWKRSLQQAERTGEDAGMIFAGAVSELTGVSVSSSDGVSDRIGAGAGVSGAVSRGTGLKGSGGIEASDQHAAFSENRISVNSSDSREEKNSVSSSRTTARTLGASIASEYGGTDSRSVSIALSRGIVNSARKSGSERSEHGINESQERKFTSSLTRLSQFQAASSAVESSDWRQSTDLRSFAYDARKKYGLQLDELRDSVAATPEGAATLRMKAADFQHRFGITDRVTAGDMALLEAAHEGNDEQKASVLAMWAGLNGNIRADGGSAEGFSDPFAVKKGAGIAVSGFNRSDARRRFDEAGGIFNAASLRTEEIRTAGDRVRGDYAAGGKTVSDGIASDAEKNTSAAVEGALGARITVVRDSAGKGILYSGGRAVDPDSLDRDSGGYLAGAFEAVGAATGENRGNIASGIITDSSFGSQIKEELMHGVDPDLRGIITSSEPVPLDPEGILRHPGLRNYASVHGFDLDNSDDLERLALRSRLLAVSQSDYHSGNAVNLAIDASALLSIQRNDAMIAEGAEAHGLHGDRRK